MYKEELTRLYIKLETIEDIREELNEDATRTRASIASLENKIADLHELKEKRNNG
jgi:peptidoglycan hydrolase CwlO-like protein